MKQSTVTWIATWLRTWAVLFSLHGSVICRETVYIHITTFRRFSKADEIGMQTNPERGTLQQTSWGLRRRIQDVSLQISVPNCVPLRGYTITRTVKSRMKFLIHLQTSSLGTDKQLNPTHFNGRCYPSMLGLKLNHVNKRGPWNQDIIRIYFPWAIYCWWLAHLAVKIY